MKILILIATLGLLFSCDEPERDRPFSWDDVAMPGEPAKLSVPVKGTLWIEERGGRRLAFSENDNNCYFIIPNVGETNTVAFSYSKTGNTLRLEPKDYLGMAMLSGLGTLQLTVVISSSNTLYVPTKNGSLIFYLKK